MRPVGKYLILLFTIMLPMNLHAGTVASISEIEPENIGEFVTLSGTASNFAAGGEPNAPIRFVLDEPNGGRIRVVVWPDIHKLIKNQHHLETTGTCVRLTAEVAEYKGKLELHIQDYAEVEITTTSTLPAVRNTLTTESLSGHTD